MCSSDLNSRSFPVLRFSAKHIQRQNLYHYKAVLGKQVEDYFNCSNRLLEIMGTLTGPIGLTTPYALNRLHDSFFKPDPHTLPAASKIKSMIKIQKIASLINLPLGLAQIYAFTQTDNPLMKTAIGTTCGMGLVFQVNHLLFQQHHFTNKHLTFINEIQNHGLESIQQAWRLAP